MPLKTIKQPWIYIVLSLFILITCFLIIFHEPNRDEAQEWLIAKDSPDIFSMIALGGYECTPMLWHTLLFILTRLGLPYTSKFILHSAIMFVALSAFLLYAPFKRYQKILFSFGYFVIYLYNVVARNYVLFPFFLFLIAAFYKERFKRPYLYSVLVVLLSMTSSHGIILALMLTLFFAYELKIDSKLRRNYAPIMILVLGLTSAILQVIPPQDLRLSTANWYFSIDRIDYVSDAPFRAFFPISLNIISPFVFVLGFLSFLFSLSFFIRKKRIFIFYLLSFLGTLSVFFFKNYAGIRHAGLIYFVFIFSLWISSSYKERPIIRSKLFLRLFSKKNLNIIFSIILIFNVISAAYASYTEYRKINSYGKEVAFFLMDSELINNNTLITSYPSEEASAILPFLPDSHPEFYYLEYEDFRSYMLWNMHWYQNQYLSLDEIDKRISKAATSGKYENVIFISTKNNITDENFLDRYELIKYFDDNPIIRDEIYYIFKLKSFSRFSETQ